LPEIPCEQFIRRGRHATRSRNDSNWPSDRACCQPVNRHADSARERHDNDPEDCGHQHRLLPELAKVVVHVCFRSWLSILIGPEENTCSHQPTQEQPMPFQFDSTGETNTAPLLTAGVLAGIAIAFLAADPAFADKPSVEADLLIVGGTESGCAAAVQAARMGVERVVLVNDIEWLGGQFSAEGLGAIDENRAHGYDGSVPIPRSGIFRDVIDAIEKKNAELYGGVRRPGNTRVITTSRPVVSEKVFRELLAPYEKSGQVMRYSNYRVKSVLTERNRVLGVEFVSPSDWKPLTIRARLTIDASDWGDVIQGSGARWDAGLDAKSEFDEPSAPESGVPSTDLNPITWCVILERSRTKSLFPEPAGYDPRYFNKLWGWIDEEFAYSSRRLVDGQGFKEIDHPDILLINSPPVDYPLDVYPADVAAALDATEAGASKKSLVAMRPEQREIVFQDARKHSLKYYYHLQQRFPKFHDMALSDEFGTADRLPPKPYIRESLRLVAQHILREQEVLGFGSRSNYATTMFPDAVFSWQFELDFHPTKRAWTTEDGDKGPWEAAFRGNRRFGRGGTGRCVFPLRALVPKDVRGLLAAQKNLGYSSIVGSSCRLHDQSIHAGQASGAVAAVSLRRDVPPAEMFLNRERLAEVWSGLVEPESGAPLVIWPFADVDPFDSGFAAIQQLALRRVLPLGPSDTSFRPDEPATSKWISELTATVQKAGYDPPRIVVTRTEKRRNIAVTVWNHIKSQPVPGRSRKSKLDADGDGIVDTRDALPFLPGTVSWEIEPDRDGLPDLKMPFAEGVRAFNFTSANGPQQKGFENDSGAVFDEDKGFGWRKDLSQNTRLRRIDNNSVRDGFVFTRHEDVWECVVENGTWKVHACLGDAGHPQPGQYLTIENQVAAKNIETGTGHFREVTSVVTVHDRRLTLTLGIPEGGSNTCLNWVILERDK
jgi:hypothetical protein